VATPNVWGQEAKWETGNEELGTMVNWDQRTNIVHLGLLQTHPIHLILRHIRYFIPLLLVGMVIFL